MQPPLTIQLGAPEIELTEFGELVKALGDHSWNQYSTARFRSRMIDDRRSQLVKQMANNNIAPLTSLSNCSQTRAVLQHHGTFSHSTLSPLTSQLVAAKTQHSEVGGLAQTLGDLSWNDHSATNFIARWHPCKKQSAKHGHSTTSSISTR